MNFFGWEARADGVIIETTDDPRHTAFSLTTGDALAFPRHQQIEGTLEEAQTALEAGLHGRLVPIEPPEDASEKLHFFNIERGSQT